MKAQFYPPVFLKLRISYVKIWLPLFLLWPLYLFILLLAYLCALVAMLITWRVAYFRVVTLFHIILCNLKGLTLEISSKNKNDTQIDIQIL